jgi:hypothetical protein
MPLDWCGLIYTTSGLQVLRTRQRTVQKFTIQLSRPPRITSNIASIFPPRGRHFERKLSKWTERKTRNPTFHHPKKATMRTMSIKAESK